MDKARLQELCQKRRWALPEYTHGWSGTVHGPRFSASVTVNGSVFQSPDAESKSVNEAQNKVAAVAFETLSAAPASSVIDAVPLQPPSQAVESISAHPSQIVGTTYKARLQELCQKRRWDLPQYTTKKVESVHEPHFFASVTINGSVFESPDADSRSIKEAQNKAAAVAFETLFTNTAADTVPLPPPSSAVQSLPPQQSQNALIVGTTCKARLQELCQKRRWDLLQYTHSLLESVREPRFIASVAVHGSVFESPDAESRSINEAHNKAAAVALESLSVTPASDVVPSPTPPLAVESISAQPSQIALETHATYKSQLQVYAQKRNKMPPTYTTVSVGLPHAPQFKATVVIDGLTFECPQYFMTMREAEHAAAEVALANLRQEENSEQNSQDEVGIPCKNRLQKYVQKRKQPLPVYTTIKDPDSSLTLFLSTVEVCGSIFKGVASTTKKQAETSAAKVALDHIEGRKKSPVSSSSSASVHMSAIHNSFSSTMESNPTVPPASLSLPISIPTSDDVMLENQSGHQKSAAQESIIEAAQESKLPINLASAAEQSRIEVAEESKPLPVNPMSVPILTTKDSNLDPAAQSNLQSTTNSICSEGSVLAATKNSDNEGIDPNLMFNQIQVYPRCPGSAVPNGSIPLPFSDDSWMAVSLISNNTGAGLST